MATAAPDHSDKGHDQETHNHAMGFPSNHPINALSRWRKAMIMLTLAYCGFLGQFVVAILLVALVPMSSHFKVTPGEIANTIGYSLLGYAVGPLFWNPLSRTVGRRPVYLLGSLLFLPVCIWEALSNNYVAFAIARVFLGLTLAFSQTIPPATVGDVFVPEVRGRKMALYGVAVVSAPAIAPFFCGLIINSTSWRVLFWFCLGLGALQLVLFAVFVPETLWVETTTAESHHAPSARLSDDLKDGHDHVETATLPHTVTGRVGAEWMPWQRPGEFLRICISPVLMMRYIVILIPSFYYGMLFAWMVGITVITPQVLGAPPYAFAVVPLGCAFLAYGLGAVLGLWSGGLVGDLTINFFERKNGKREPEDRLWALYPILPLMFLGLLILGLSVEHSWHWMGMLMGGAIYFFCLSAATGVLQTYVLETYLPKGMDSMAVFNFWRMAWGFAVAFFAMQWGVNVGWTAAYAAQGALAAGLGAILCAALIWKGKSIRAWQGMPMLN